MIQEGSIDGLRGEKWKKILEDGIEQDALKIRVNGEERLFSKAFVMKPGEERLKKLPKDTLVVKFHVV